MADARARLEWNQTAEVLAMLYSAHRNPEKSWPLTAADFNPFHAEEEEACHISVIKDSVLRRAASAA